MPEKDKDRIDDLKASIINGLSLVSNGEKGTNAIGEPVDDVRAAEMIYEGVRGTYVALKHLGGDSQKLPDGLLNRVQAVFEEHLIQTKAHYDKIELRSGGQIRFEW